MLCLHRKNYHWVDSLSHDAEISFLSHLQHLLPAKTNDIVFLCVGTPLLYGDRLGPHIGSSLQAMGIANVFGTITAPVHAENIEEYRNLIKEKYINPTIIAIDAALGSKSQTGFITLRRGALKPGKGLGKKIPSIGTIEITGIFDSIYHPGAQTMMIFMSSVIIKGICQHIGLPGKAVQDHHKK